MNLESLFGNPAIAVAATNILKKVLIEQNIKTVVLRFNKDAPEDAQFTVDLSPEMCTVIDETTASVLNDYIKKLSTDEHNNPVANKDGNSGL